MWAWVKENNKRGLISISKDIPIILDNEVLVKVLAAGICGTDISIYQDHRVVPEMLTIGHEFCGEIIKIGRSVKNFEIGDIVTPDIIVNCERCKNCINGHIEQCMNLREIGIHIDGGFAEFVAVPEVALHKLPNEFSAVKGASIEPVAVAYSALEKIKDNILGKSVIINGPGAIGLYLTQLAIASGASSVIVLGRKTSNQRLEMAKKFGAKTINISEENIRNSLIDFVHSDKVDYIFEASGIGNTIGNLTEYLKPHGKMILLGNYKELSEINFIDMVRNEYSICGSFCYTHSEFEAALQLVVDDKINIQDMVKLYSSDKLEDGFEDAINRRCVKAIIECR